MKLITEKQLNKKYPIANPDDEDDDIDDYYLSQLLEELDICGFESCCGFKEMAFDGGLRRLESSRDFEDFKFSEEFLFDCLSYLLECNKVAGFILTDVKKYFTKINKVLS